MVTSEIIEDFFPPSQLQVISSPPSATASSTPLDPDDPDFLGPPPPKVPKTKAHHASIKLNRENWIRHLHLKCSAKTSNAEIFRHCAATLQAGGCNLDDFAISEEWIRLERKRLDKETAVAIKVVNTFYNTIAILVTFSYCILFAC